MDLCAKGGPQYLTWFPRTCCPFPPCVLFFVLYDGVVLVLASTRSVGHKGKEPSTMAASFVAPNASVIGDVKVICWTRTSMIVMTCLIPRC